MKAPWSYLPALPACVGLVSGIIIADFTVNILPVAIIFVAAGILLYFFKYHYLAFIAIFTFIGCVIYDAHKPNTLSPLIFDTAYEYSAEIENSQESKNSVRYTIVIDSLDHGRVPRINCSLSVIGTTTPLPSGSRIRFKGKLYDVYSPSEVPHATDFNRYLKYQGIVCHSIIRVNGLSVVAPPDKTHALVNHIRDKLYNGIVSSPISSATASFLVAAILGDDCLLSDSDYDNFRTVGIAHILALSGLHVGIITCFIVFLLFPFNAFRRGRYIKGIVTILVVWIYAVLVGLSPSIVRASVMVTVFVMASMLQNGYNSFNSLLLSVVFILCINPLWLFTPVFQLSVGAVASILLFCGLVPLSLRRRACVFWASMLVVVPLSAMASTGIIGAYYFHTFPLLFLVANIFVGVLFPWIVILGIILIITTLLGFDFTVIGCITDFLFHVMYCGISALSSMTVTHISGIYFSAWIMLPYFLCLLLIYAAIKYRKRVALIAAAGMIVVSMVVFEVSAERMPSTELYIPSSRHATDIIIRNDGEAWLVTDAKDEALEFRKAEKLYKDFLISRGCEDRFKPVNQNITAGNITVNLPFIYADGKVICLIEDSLPAFAPKHIDYALIGRNYAGHIREVVEALNPDTLLLSSGMNLRRREKLTRECGDSLIFKDLRSETIKIIIF